MPMDAVDVGGFMLSVLMTVLVCLGSGAVECLVALEIPYHTIPLTTCCLVWGA